MLKTSPYCLLGTRDLAVRRVGIKRQRTVGISDARRHRGERRYMPTGMFSLQNDIGWPKTRVWGPLIPRRCAAAERPYGPAPKIATSAHFCIVCIRIRINSCDSLIRFVYLFKKTCRYTDPGPLRGNVAVYVSQAPRSSTAPKCFKSAGSIPRRRNGFPETEIQKAGRSSTPPVCPQNAVLEWKIQSHGSEDRMSPPRFQILLNGRG